MGMEDDAWGCMSRDREWMVTARVPRKYPCVCEKVRHLGCLFVVRGSWVFWLGEMPAVRVEGCKIERQMLCFVIVEIKYILVTLA